MKAFILGAGLGKRLQPLSNEIPAPMLPILNKPLIIYIIEHLKKFGIKEIKISLHHLPEMIDAYLGEGDEFNLKITYSLEKDLLGTAAAIKRIPSYFDDTILIHYGNRFANIDIMDFYNFHKSKKSIFSYAVIENKSIHNTYEIIFNQNSKIIDFRFRKKKSESPYIPAGIFLAEKEILDYIPNRANFSLEEELLFMICELNLESYAYIIKGESFQVIHPKDLLDTNLKLLKILTNSEKQVVLGDKTKIHKEVYKSLSVPLMIGTNSEIKKNVTIKDSVVIGDNVIIDEGTTLSNSLILNNTYIGKNLEIENSIVYKNLCINVTRDFGVYVTDNFLISPVNKAKLKDQLRKTLFRILDILLALFGLIFLFPLMLIIAIAIKLDSRGPIFYRSKRLIRPQLIEKSQRWYRYEPEEYVYYIKFRTMKIETLPNEKISGLNVYREGPYFKAKDDPRITKVGKFLRKTSLDELPLLFNVLKGDIRLVGVWGLPPEEAQSLYHNGLSKEFLNLKDVAQVRFKGKLGLAGYWQSRGRSELTAEERTIHDSVQAIVNIEDEKLIERLGEYKTDSVKQYISLILDTVKSVIKRKGAY